MFEGGFFLYELRLKNASMDAHSYEMHPLHEQPHIIYA